MPDPTPILRTSEPYNVLASALAKAQGEMDCPPKNSWNEATKSRYADFHAIRQASKAALSKHDLCVMQAPGEGTDGARILTTRITHGESAQWAECSLSMMPVMQRGKDWVRSDDPQSISSILTYARRITLSLLLALSAEEEDDGNHASGTQQNGQRQPQQRPQAAPPKQLTPDEVIAASKAIDDATTAGELHKLRKTCMGNSQLVEKINGRIPSALAGSIEGNSGGDEWLTKALEFWGKDPSLASDGAKSLVLMAAIPMAGLSGLDACAELKNKIQDAQVKEQLTTLCFQRAEALANAEGGAPA